MPADLTRPLRRLVVTGAVVPLLVATAASAALAWQLHGLLAPGDRARVFATSVGLAVTVALAVGWVTRVHLRRLVGLCSRSLDEARASVRARDDFLSIAAHELKTPLTSLRLATQSLARSARGGTPPDVARRVSLIGHSADRLAALVDQLLEAARLAAGRVELHRAEEMDLGELAAAVVLQFEERAREAGTPLRLHLSGAVAGTWDPVRMELVLSNLLSNALKYGAGRDVDVGVADLGDTARVWVKDRGLGIDPADHERIFHRFERAVPKRNYGGLGIGLWAVRLLVDAHGGTVRVESARGNGATFTVEVPKRLGVGCTELAAAGP